MTDARLVLVTGKGGVGKSTVAAALAWALVERGRRTLLAALGESFAPAPPGARVLQVAGAAALDEYLGLVLPRLVVRRIVASPIYRQFVTGAPGLRELMALGKVMDEARRGAWDSVVVDTPATGHVLQALRMPGAAAGLFGGLVRRETERLIAELRNRRWTRVLPVAIAEELVVKETVELVARLETLGLAIGPVIVNQVHFAPLAPDDVPPPPPSASPVVVAALRRGREEAAWAALNRRRVASLRARLHRRLVQLPFLFCETVGAAELALLRGELARQGVA